MAEIKNVSGVSQIVATAAASTAASDDGVRVANPLRAGARITDDDYVVYNRDATIDFTLGGKVWNVGGDGSAFRADGKKWVAVDKPDAAVLAMFAALAKQAPKDPAAAGVVTGAPVNPATTTVQPAALELGTDRVERRTGPQSSSEVDELRKQVDALRSQVGTLKRSDVEQATKQREEEKARAAAEAAAAREATEPGFLKSVARALMEIAEFASRFLTPFANLAALIVRVLRIIVALVQGQHIDWTKEGLRALGDLAGCFFPPAGAIANSAFNLWWDESQLTGGVNEIFDGADIRNPFRRAAEGSWNAVSGLFGGKHDVAAPQGRADSEVVGGATPAAAKVEPKLIVPAEVAI